MNKMQRFLFEYTAVNQVPSICEVTVFPEKKVVVVTDEDTGGSVTNNIELIAALLKNRGVEFDHLFEHYRGKKVYGRTGRTFSNEETFDLVMIEWNSVSYIYRNWKTREQFSLPQHEWKPSTRDHLEQLIGQVFPD